MIEDGTQIVGIPVISEVGEEDVDVVYSDHHCPISPATPAESLFLAGLGTSHISAAALSQQIRQTHRPFVGSSSVFSGSGSVTTDDFATACDSPEEIDSLFDHNDAILHSRELSIEEYRIYNEPTTTQHTDRSINIMPATTAKPVTATSSGKKPVVDAKKPIDTKKPVDTKSVKEEMKHLDPASHVYEGAKGVWAWGKGVMVFSPFLGIAEGVASKVVGVVGTNLEEIDGTIKPKLNGLDDGLLNPAIEAVVGVLLGAVGKSEEIVKPIVTTLLKPLDFLIKNEPENDPEVTAPAAATGKK